MVTALCPERGPEQPLRSASWFRAAVMTYWELHANTVSQSSLSESLRLILVISGSSISLRLPVYDSDLLQPECRRLASLALLHRAIELEAAVSSFKLALV
jgi:hypothetical protein